MNTRGNLSARARRAELGALVGDRHEMVGPARHADASSRAPEVRRQRVRLDRRARLARQQIQRVLAAAWPRRAPRPDRSNRACETRGQPGATPSTARRTSGARLEPPMPSSTTSVKPSRLDAGRERPQPLERVGHQRRGAQPAEAVARSFCWTAGSSLQTDGSRRHRPAAARRRSAMVGSAHRRAFRGRGAAHPADGRAWPRRREPAIARAGRARWAFL